MRVKFCGITTLEDAREAARLGAWAVGLIHHDPSPRRVDSAIASEIGAELRRRVDVVGVFVNAPLDDVVAAAEDESLTMLQLHGDEGPAFCQEAARRSGCKVIKAMRVRSGADITAAEAFRTDYHLFDAYRRGTPGGTGESFDWELLARRSSEIPALMSGGLGPDNVAEAIELTSPFAVDVASGVESEPGVKDHALMAEFIERAQLASAGRAAEGGAAVSAPDPPGAAGGGVAGVEERFGPYGGRFVPEVLMAALDELSRGWVEARADAGFQTALERLLHDFVGRPTPLYLAERLSERVGRRIYLKREDLAHTGAHKINNAVGQALLARRMGKERVIAETGAGQHGVATATACALLGLDCVVYMGTEDMRRQAPNVERMRLLGAEVSGVEAGARTLKEAVSAAIRDWVTNVANTHYIIGSAVGPAPYPALVRDLQRVIGDEAREQALAAEGALPERVIACVGGGSNAIGAFYAFLDDPVELIGIEAGGEGLDGARHGASLVAGRTGVLHGALSSILADADGQILEAHSVSAGLDYPGVGPEHAHLRDSGRARYEAVTDADALRAFCELARLEGIVPALEPSHAIAWLLAEAGPSPGAVGGGAEAATAFDVVCLSGRGDKDMAEVTAHLDKLDGETRTGTGVERIGAAFSAARDEGRAALMPYAMGGFPDATTSAAVLAAYVEGGADVIELGVPFSDPLADGPVIHSAATVALRSGATLGSVTELASGVAPSVPVVLMVYANMVLAQGPAAFAAGLDAGGVAGAIVPDLPPEEAAEVRAELSDRGLAFVPLVAPTTPPPRRREICAAAKGFVYLVSDTRTTGERDALPEHLSELVATAKAEAGAPVAVGFGIGTPEQAAEVGAAADGVIIGSRLVRAVAEADGAAAAADAVGEFVQATRAALSAGG